MHRLFVLGFVVACSGGNMQSSSGSGGAPPAPTKPAARPATPEVAIVNADYLHVRGKNYEGVIAQTKGAWTPSPSDIAEVEASLGPALAAHAELGPSGPTSRWKRQYTGLETEGNKQIRIDLACQADAWPTQGVPSVKGGGTCYGFATFDYATRSITVLEANASK